MFRAIRRHPLISAILIGCTLAGVLAGVWGLDPGWSLARRAGAGAVGGAGVGLLISATKMIGP